MNGYGLLGILVAAIGILTLYAPGGWDVLSVANILMGGLLIGMSWAHSLLR